METIVWNASQTPSELHAILDELAREYPIARGGPGLAVRFERGAPRGVVSVCRHGPDAAIHYDRPCHALRGVSALLANLVAPGQTRTETLAFETLGIMLDCSRNAVMTVEHLGRWLRRLALLGYNMAMLYTEDTYELPGEECLGLLRGRYTADELRAIDALAGSLGIELIGCIQTLGHLEQVLRWPAYKDLVDSPSVLMVDEDRTYALVDKMIAQWARCLRSRRIHVGMDETYGLGRGRFVDRFGPQREYDLFNRHLARVLEACQRHGLSPMIWSDMYFALGSPTGWYYDPQCRIPPDVVEAIPRQAQLVYWDYYHDNEDFYLDWIARHRAMGFEPVMASGVWTWGWQFWYGRAQTEANAVPCIRACRRAGLKEIFFTLWGDDGAYCEYDSALAGLALAADHAYNEAPPPADLSRRFAAVVGADYQAIAEAADMNEPVTPAGLVWDDPLLALFYKNGKLKDARIWDRAQQHYQQLAQRLLPWADATEPVDMAHALRLVRFKLAKVQMLNTLFDAYPRRDMPALTAVRPLIDAALDALDALAESFRRQWLRRNKPWGLETMQVRFGAQRERLGELRRRLDELLAGRGAEIPELDQWPTAPAELKMLWRNYASGSAIL